MKKIIFTTFGLLAVLAGTSFAQTNVIYSDANDGMLENRDEPSWTTGPVIHNIDDWNVSIGEWYGPGLTTAVFPFQLPDLGAINNPFDTADFGVNLYRKGDAISTDIDLYAVRVDASPLISADDWYNGAGFDTNAILIQEGFLTFGSTIVGPGPNNTTDADGDAALLSYLNEAYDGGNGAGQYVFLRLSFGNSYVSQWDAYNVTTRNAQYESDWPVITLTVINMDSDWDGLPDVWETENGLDPYDDGTTNVNNGAIGDPDLDTLLNIDEYALGTDPQDPDSDGDGIDDDVEMFTSFTDPLDADSDDDGLSDGDEVNLYGTEPLEVDTDEDGESDYLEVMQGTDPLDSASNSAADGLVVVDGILEGAYDDFYPLAWQTVNSSWATDNEGELNAAYATVQDGKLCLFLAGNLDEAYNKLQIFIDSSDAITTNVLKTAGNAGTDVMDGLVFDEGFSPEYHLNIRRGMWSPNPEDGNLNLDFANLVTSEYDAYDSLFGLGVLEGSAYTGTGVVNALPIAVAYNDSNTNGVVTGTDAANFLDVLSVTTGLELSIALSDLGDPHGEIRIMAMICEEPNSPISNQILGGLTAPSDALGVASNVNFSALSGDQFFPVTVSIPAPIVSWVEFVSGNTQVNLGLSDLSIDSTYMIQDATTLSSTGFIDVAGSEFIADGTNAVLTLPVDMDAHPVRFFRAVAP